jgi:hemolysin III
MNEVHVGVDPAALTELINPHLSPSARRLLRRPRPRYRGVLHRWAALVWIPVGLIITVSAGGPRATVAVAVFSIGVFAMLTTSAVVHSRDWNENQVERLVRLDHSAIFLMFATTATPIARLGLDAPVSTWLLVVVWTGAAVGIVAEWLPVHPPVGIMNAAFLTLGWGTIVFLPWMVAHLSVAQLALLFTGGAAYTLGAVVVGARRPDPWPDHFGYHEIWHVLVVIAAGMHTALVINLAFM